MYVVKIGQAVAKVPEHRVSVTPVEGRRKCSVIWGNYETMWGMNAMKSLYHMGRNTKLFLQSWALYMFGTPT